MGAVETQIVQLRTEMRDEFSEIRRDMVTKQDFKTELAAIREEMVTKDDLRDELSRFATKDDLNALRDNSEKTSPTWAVTSRRDYWNRRVGRAS